MIQITKHEVYSTEGKFVHRIGTDTYFKRGTILGMDTEADFEEVDVVPPYTREEYAREVERLIGLRYTTGQEIQFAREGEAAGEKFGEYLRYVELCKTLAKEGLEARASE